MPLDCSPRSASLAPPPDPLPRTPSPAPRAAAGPLAALPNPRHLFAYLTGSRHYHIGTLEDDRGSLPDALERQSLRSAGHVPARARVLDVGCGLGGTSLLLAERGHTVVGIDPCGACVAHARAGCHGGSARFEATDLQGFAATHAGPRFDALVMIEALQHFPSPGALFSTCARLLAPGGTLVVHDLVKLLDLPFERVPWHRPQELLGAATAAGLVLEARVELTSSAARSLDLVLRELRRRRGEVARAFRPYRPLVEAEIEEVLVQVEHVRRGLAEGALLYEELVLRAPGSARCAAPASAPSAP